MITIESNGKFDKTTAFLQRLSKMDARSVLRKYAQEGVEALRSATPVDSGKTANSWRYEIKREGETYTIFWNNSNINKGVNIAIILQYGHGTRNGGYVVGRDYINPAIRPVFDRIANEMWKEVIGE